MTPITFIRNKLSILILKIDLARSYARRRKLRKQGYARIWRVAR